MSRLIAPAMPAVDYVHKGVVSGSVAQKLLAANGDIRVLRTNATLTKDAWKQLDRKVIEISKIRLVGVGDLMSRGLTLPVDGLGVTVLEYEKESDLNDAALNMDGVTRSRNDRLEWELNYLPLPIIHKDFQINMRALLASRRGNRPLDTTSATIAGRKVAELTEKILFQGASLYNFGGGTIYGYTDFPDRNTVTLGANWDASGVTGDDILDDLLAMKAASLADRHYGPWGIYVPPAYDTALDRDFKANGDLTIRQRMLEVTGIQFIKVADHLPANNVVMVEMTEETVRMVIAQEPRTVEWEAEGGMVHNFKVLSCMVPQLRSDKDGRSGIVHLS